MAVHKETRMRVAADAEALACTTVEMFQLPAPPEPTEAQPDSDEGGIAEAVMDPSVSRDDHDPVDDGFAALRAQRALRKKLMRDHKRTSTNVHEVSKRATTVNLDRGRVLDEVDDS